MHGDLIHMPPSKLHALTSQWPFSVWGIDIIGKISPKSSNGHEYILVAIDYFTKRVEATFYVRLIAARLSKFIISHIICRYGVPHELISDRGVHFRGKVDLRVFSERVKCGENIDPCAQVYASSSHGIVASQVSFPRREVC